MKPSSDPVRINNSSFSVETAGIAPGAYRLVSDKTKFHLNNMTSLAASLPSGSSGNYEIYGDTPSSSMFDAELSLETVEGTTLCTTNITVLWVGISMRCGQDDDFSSDNACAIKPSPAKLGAQRVYVGGVEVSMGNNVEFVGSVHPSDFVSGISMNRDNTNAMLVAKMPSGGWKMLSYEPLRPRGTEPACNDSTEPSYQDRNPAPNGRVFDFDTPGIGVSAYATLPEGTVLYEIQNFLQYALWNQKRCSNDFPWFSRTSLVKNPTASYFIFNFASRGNHPEDNSCGYGATPLVVY